jgi:tyrosyl-tRNA synthetase
MSKDEIIADILSRSVDNIVDRDHLAERLKSGKKLRIKLGVDPTSPNVHLGRSVPLLKLRRFQELGHQVIFLVGSFTAVIGDTSDKEAERKMLAEAEVKENMATYLEQVGKILDLNQTEVVYNGDWLSKLTYEEVARQADAFSVNDFISRSNIKKRLDEGKRVSLREMLYPMMQGYDSVVLKADIELGGADQWFNLLAGRTMQKFYGQEPQDILTTLLIEGLDGRKMSSSWGNTINITDTPQNMFGRLMTVRDELIGPYFDHLTVLGNDERDRYKEMLVTNGTNPRDVKAALAFEITKFYHGAEAAEEAQNYFNSVFRDKERPTDIQEREVLATNIVEVLVELNFVDSKSEARRLIEQKGVRINDDPVESVEVEVKNGDIVSRGKLKIAKIVIK